MWYPKILILCDAPIHLKITWSQNLRDIRLSHLMAKFHWM